MQYHKNPTKTYHINEYHNSRLACLLHDALNELQIACCKQETDQIMRA